MVDGKPWHTYGSVMGYLSLVRISQFINSTVPFPDSTNWLRFCFGAAQKKAFQRYIPQNDRSITVKSP